MPPVKITSTKRQVVRLSLVTGSTLATIIGAQSLAALNQKTPLSSSPVAPEVVDQGTGGASPVTYIQGDTPTSTQAGDIVHAAPTIKIVRHPGQAGAVSQNAPAQNIVIKPPVPIQLAAPAPVIVQAPGAAPAVGVAQAAAPAPAPAPVTKPATRSSR